jgi:hypothetical protein
MAGPGRAGASIARRFSVEIRRDVGGHAGVFASIPWFRPQSRPVGLAAERLCTYKEA